MSSEKIVVVGLGYVGLPLAVALANRYTVIGFDIDKSRIEQLKNYYDRTAEVSAEALRSTNMLFTDQESEITGATVYIVTVPTPVDNRNNPDLRALSSASTTVGRVLSKDSIVVYESTVYPGVTEDFCGPIIEKNSGLKLGQDFFLGYSPERINPGDKIHTVDKITKVVAGQTPEIAERLAGIYGSMNNNNIFIASSIKVAEASKVIENSQRDINIAFVNEITVIFQKLGISVHDVLAAAQTKWNFLPFTPGLVGGHCIGVDPFYLADCAKKLGHNPEVILAGRRINDHMGIFIADQINQALSHSYGNSQNILILGLTFKENVPDLRNSKVIDLINRLRTYGHNVEVHDPLAHPEEAKEEYGIDILTSLGQHIKYDCVVGAVAHDVYKNWGEEKLKDFLSPNGLIADIKNIWPQIDTSEDLRLWRL